MGTMAERFVGSSGSASSNGMGGMLNVEFNMDAVRQHIEDLGKMLTTNNDMRERLRTIIRKEIKAARAKIAKDVHNNLGSDPRKAYRAVRHTIYKQVLGGNINILAPRTAGARYALVRSRKMDANPHQWGGNRRPRSPRTEALETYFGKDRGFILRFNNSGTHVREIAWGPNTRLRGNRGSIAPRAVFSTPALYQTQAAIAAINEAFEQEFVTAWNEL